MNSVGVIGLGNIATRHRKNLKTLFPTTQLYAMSASGRKPTENITNCDCIVESIPELIQCGVGLVIVASPAPFHAKHAIPLLEAGIPTLIEKPVTCSVEEAKNLQVVASKTKTKVAVGYCLRYLPSALKIKELLEQSALGDLYNVYIEVGQYLPDWRPSKDYRASVSARPELGGGALLELSHELDYAQWLFGDLTVQYAYLRTSDELGLKVEDLVDVVATNESGLLINTHLDFLQRKAYRRCRIVGSEGTIEWDLIKNEVKLQTKMDEEFVYSDSSWDKNKMYMNMLQDFINMANNMKHDCIDLQQAAKTVKFIEAINQYASPTTHG